MFGLNIDPNNPRGNPDPAELRELGVETVRYTFYDSSGGDQIDPGKARFYREKTTAYKEAGIDSLIILTYDTYPNRPSPEASDQEWDNYIERFARRAGQIAGLLAPYQPAFQVWNEPDHPVHQGYVPTLREAVFGRMLRRTHQAIKAVNPNFMVVTAGLASGDPNWLTRVTQSLGGDLPADIVAFHPYGQRPDQDWPRPDWAFGYVGNLLNNYRRAAKNKPLWITEIGVKEEDLNRNREQTAEFLRRYYRAIGTRYNDRVHKLFWFCYSDGMVPSFGLIDSAGNRKPAYQAFRLAVTERPAPQPAVPVAPPPPPPLQPTTPPTQPEIPTPVQPTPPSTSPTPSPAAWPELTQLLNQMASLQAQLQQQMAGLQAQLQQLLTQQSQTQAQLQAWQAQLVARLESGPTTPPPPPAGVQRPVPAIQNITSHLKRDPARQFPTRPPEQIQRIIIHHTAIPPTIGADRIAIHRVDKQGWPGIGYHYFITHDGLIQQTNEVTTVSTHAGPYDPIALGVCFAGDFTQTSPTPAQIDAGGQLIAWLLSQFGLSMEAVAGYKELVNTQSPGLQWDNGQRWGEQLKEKIRAYLV